MDLLWLVAFGCWAQLRTFRIDIDQAHRVARLKPDGRLAEQLGSGILPLWTDKCRPEPLMPLDKCYGIVAVVLFPAL